MQTITLQAVPAQVCKSVLGGQNCQINLYQKAQGLFVDISADDIDICIGAVARNLVPIIARTYSGFVGNFIFVDTQGDSDPNYSGFGSRFSLVYLTAEEYALIQ